MPDLKGRLANELSTDQTRNAQIGPNGIWSCALFGPISARIQTARRRLQRKSPTVKIPSWPYPLKNNPQTQEQKSGTQRVGDNPPMNGPLSENHINRHQNNRQHPYFSESLGNHFGRCFVGHRAEVYHALIVYVVHKVNGWPGQVP